jgi:hypothetical protein
MARLLAAKWLITLTNSRVARVGRWAWGFTVPERVERAYCTALAMENFNQCL